MATNATNPFDCLPDELVEYIFNLIVYSPSTESFNLAHAPSSPFYFPYKIHEPELRRTYKDLLSLEKVCRRFYKLLQSSTFWLQKCRHDHSPVVNESLAIAQGVNFRRLYFSNPFHPDYNLLDWIDTNEDENKEFWSTNVSYEQTPIGCDLLYDVFGQISSCYATSYSWGQYARDNIQLLRKGEEQLILINPVIEFSVCVAGRWDCSSTCDFELCFSNEHTWRYTRSFSNGDRQWHRITYRYVNYPENQMPSHVSIHLQGKDRQFWAGNYGAKFAQIKLRLLLREDDQTENQELEETLTEPEQSNLEELL